MRKEGFSYDAARRLGWCVLSALILMLVDQSRVDAQQPPPAEIDRMLPPQSDQLTYYKWQDGTPITVVVVTGKQSGRCVEMKIDGIRQEVNRIRALVPELRNIRDPERAEWVPQVRMQSPLLIGLDMENGTIQQAMQQYSKFNDPRARFQEFDRSSRLVGFGEGFGTASGRIVVAYSWTTGAGGLGKYSDDVCRSSAWEGSVLTGLLGRRGFRVIVSTWAQSLPSNKREPMWALVDRLFLKALYNCPGSPADRDCVRRKLHALAADPSLMPR